MPGTDIATLAIRVQSLEADLASKRLDGLTKSGGRAEKSTRGVTKSTAGMGAAFSRVLGPIALAAGAMAGLRKTVDVARQFDVLNAQLVTATGSAKLAAEQFSVIEKFASETPFALEQSVQAFVKLKNLGLDPSEAALRSYGNTASAMGKDLDQLIEAVADAATGEFERLKEFGIRASKQGDGVSFTFRGVTTTVKNNAAEIEGYLQRLGNVEFGGAMKRQSETLDGAISNLGDTWNKLFRTITQNGVGDAIETSVRGATSALEVAIGFLDAFGLATRENATAGADAVDDTRASVDDLAQAFEDGSEKSVEALGETRAEVEKLGDDVETMGERARRRFATDVKEFPINMRLVTDTIALDVVAWVKELGISYRTMVDVFRQEVGAMIELATAGGKQIADALKFYDGNTFDFDAETKAINNATDARIEKIRAEAEAQKDVNRAAVNTLKIRAADRAEADKGTVNGAGAPAPVDPGDPFGPSEFGGNFTEIGGAAGADFADGFSAEVQLRNLGIDLGQDVDIDAVLGRGENKGGKSSGGSSSRASKSADREAERAAAEFDSLVNSLRTQEEAIDASYKERQAIIDRNTEEGTVSRLELSDRLASQYEEDKLRQLEIEDNFGRGVFERLANQEALITQSYERRRESILSAENITNQERIALLEKAEGEYTERTRQLQAEQNQAYLGAASSFFGDLSALASSENEKAAKIGKAAAIAQTTIKTYEAATGAYAALAGIPYVGPALGIAAAAAAVAAGLANVQQIKSTNYAGGYETGGLIPPGSVGLLEGNAPELVKGPAAVTSQRTTAGMLQNRNAKSGGDVYVNITAPKGYQAETKESESDRGREIQVLFKQFDEQMANGIDTGRTKTAQSMKSTFGLSR